MRGRKAGGQLCCDCSFGKNHFVCPQTQEDIPVHFIVGLAYDMLHAERFEIHEGDNRECKIAADRQDNDITAADTQLFQDILFLEIRGHGARDIICNIIDTFSVAIDSKDILTLPAELDSKLPAEAAESENGK